MLGDGKVSIASVGRQEISLQVLRHKIGPQRSAPRALTLTTLVGSTQTRLEACIGHEKAISSFGYDIYEGKSNKNDWRPPKSGTQRGTKDINFEQEEKVDLHYRSKL